MNSVYFSGRLMNDPDIRATAEGKSVVRFSFAVNRRFKREGDAEADFFSCVVFGKAAERFEKLNIKKGVKLILTCEARNNNYTDREGVKRYEVQFVVTDFEFCEKKAQAAGSAPDDDFASIPDGIDDEEFPFR